MSDHGDAPDPRTDIADLYAFAAPGNDRSVLVLNINSGASAPEARFDPAASYELKIDTDGDLEADVAFHVLFASSPGGGGAATVYRSAGAAARGTGPIGDVVIADAPVPEGGEIRVVAADGYRFCAGLRSDPFFFDGAGLRNSFRFTGTDAFADRNVFAIVLEVPNAALGTAGPVGVWARTMAPVHGRVVHIDQAGRPGTNIIFNRAEAIGRTHAGPRRDRRPARHRAA